MRTEVKIRRAFERLIHQQSAAIGQGSSFPASDIGRLDALGWVLEEYDEDPSEGEADEAQM